jgi:NAD(P)H-hydrate epimerase|tara:strand:+ start:26065 stop:27555 length:1491 start_codon:yes stop_codon:yes gene_type:complete
MENLPENIYSSFVVREIDSHAISSMRTSSYSLMCRAGEAAQIIINTHYSEAKKIVIFCGDGNNGGDGFILASLLLKNNKNVIVISVGSKESLSEEANQALNLYITNGGVVKKFEKAASYINEFEPDLYVDAILGIGISRNISGFYLEAINFLNSSSIPIVSIDIPSGLNSDTGIPMKIAVKASITIVLIALKQGLFLANAADYVGKIKFDGLGVPLELYDIFRPSLRIMNLSSLPSILPMRSKSSYKGDNGTLLVVGGNENMGGAITLAAESALRSGVGMVKVATHIKNKDFILKRLPEVLCFGIETSNQLEDCLDDVDAIVLGPGLGNSSWSNNLYRIIINSKLPIILDADALNILARDKEKRDNWILTPHPGEASKLLDKNSKEIQCDRMSNVKKISDRFGGVVVLKGCNTLVMQDGESSPSVCTYGNSGMAVAGMGDVLAGIIGSLVAQNIKPIEAAIAGVMIHALAGDAESINGKKGMIPSDLMSHIRRIVN